jgi:hypothetical protein
MPNSPLETPLMMAFLRALTVVGLTEAIFYRLLPEPGSGSLPGLLRRMHASLNSAGSLGFFLAVLFVVLALIQLAYRTARVRAWPAGLNGFLAVCFLCLASLGFVAASAESGPGFAIGFTLLALATLLFLAMHAFAASPSVWIRAFAVCYAAAAICSAAGTLPRFLGRLAAEAPPAIARFLPSGPSPAAAGALSAGYVLLAVAGALAFLAFCDLEGRSSWASTRLAFSILPSGLAAMAFALGCLIAPSRMALLGGHASGVTVLLLTSALFLGTLTAASAILDPPRRGLGFGLLMLVLAGYPLRIAHQDMLMVLGSALVFAPRHAVTPAGPAGAEPQLPI